MTKFNELREQYKEFIYRDFSIEYFDGACRITFDFSIPGLADFAPTWEFPMKEKVDEEILRTFAFNLGMAESISYWKCACPKTMKVVCGTLSKEQKTWWRKLYYNGLGEFMYINQIEISEEALVEIECEETTIHPLKDIARYSGCMIPVGGGKDSVVSLELLKNEDVTTYHINLGSAIQEVIDAYDYKKEDYKAKRILAPEMLELNRQGYLNGHTPFSAIVAFSSVIAAFLTKRKYIVLSNETSANETTVRNSFVNHQYSKSYEFEQDFSWYLETMADSDIHYFSFLRPLAEIQIAYIFSRCTEFHKIFRSCNVGSKKGIWCCDCAKCLFVYIILSPFLEEEQMVDIFGENLLNKESLDHCFRELTGIEKNKPFECVGTRKEVLVALKSFVKKGGNTLLTERYKETILSEQTELSEMLEGWVEENSVPEEYQKILKAQFEHVVQR